MPIILSLQLGIQDDTLILTLSRKENPIPLDAFSTGQKEDAIAFLGDPKNADGGPDWDNAFLTGNIHGLIIVSGDSHASVLSKVHDIEAIFGVNTSHSSLKVIISIVGDVRPGDQAGHEQLVEISFFLTYRSRGSNSFGFLDGISNPLVKGFDDANTNPGPVHVDPGVIVTGHTGDVKQREEWAKDGSFLAFRYLFQNVPEFNTFLKEHPIAQDGNGTVLTPEEGSELLGARMVGRWKSGMSNIQWGYSLSKLVIPPKARQSTSHRLRMTQSSPRIPRG